jgi:hypothetical protein
VKFFIFPPLFLFGAAAIRVLPNAYYHAIGILEEEVASREIRRGASELPEIAAPLAAATGASV